MNRSTVFCVDIENLRTLEISALEWIFLCVVDSLETDGVCSAPKESLAEEIGVARRSVFNIIDKMCKKELLKKYAAGIATTKKWKNIYKAIEPTQKPRIEAEHLKQPPKEKPKKKDKFDELLSQMPKEKREGYKEIHLKIMRDFYEYRKKIKPIKTPRPLEMYLNELKKIQDAGLICQHFLGHILIS